MVGFFFDFNSKMVRLWVHFVVKFGSVIVISIPKWYDYELKGYDLSLVYTYFNSKMVRLWAFHLLPNPEPNYISIPKWYDYENPLVSTKDKVEINFNSKMVRLWESLGLNTVLTLPNFNSKMVRLWARSVRVCSLRCKISIPKWYDYECCAKGFYSRRILFQFQNGTIMSDPVPVVVSTLVEFQFQNGTIMSI